MPRHLFLTLIVFFFTVSLSTAADSGEKSIGELFHEQTSFGDSGMKGDEIVFGEQIPLYKTYPGTQRVKLPEPAPLDLELGRALAERLSIRRFGDGAVDLRTVSALLLAADGLTHKRSGFDMRSAPSGGALYPLDIYLIAENVNGLEKGLYHFLASDSSLELVKNGDLGDELYRAANNQSAVGDSPLALIITARFERSTAKYADRGYRYTYIEVGAVCQNVYLAAASLELGTVAVGAFNDDRLNGLLEIDGREEAAILIMPVGYPVE